jgi:spermidine synthase
MNRKDINFPVFLLFFISGGCGLIYQVVWSRMLTHIFGSTVLAVSTVLAAFMAGLALGSHYLGKRGDRIANPLQGFAACEIGVGLSALLLLPLLSHLAPFYVWITRSFDHSFTLLSVARLILALAFLLVPTTLMGATLPLLSRFAINRLDKAGHTLAALYGTNALGAIFGALATGFHLIGSLGLHRTIGLAALLNIGVGAVAWWISRRKTAADVGQRQAPSTAAARAQHDPPTPYQRRLQRLLLGGFAFSGVTSLAYEVLWTRALIFFVGNSIYAFVIMLSAFLTGIVAGSYAILFFIDRLKHPLRAFAWVQVGIAISAAGAMPLLGWLMGQDSLQKLLFDPELGWHVTHLARFGLCFAVMLVPTLLIGMTFPLVGRIVLTDLEHTSADIGKVYAVNTLGNIAGALLPGFLLIPLVGIRGGIWMMALINLANGILFLAHGKTRLHPWRLVPGATVVVLFVLIMARPTHFRFPAQGLSADDEVLYYREGPSATTMVYAKADSGNRHMAIDGVTIGGTDPAVDYKQQWLAHLPKLLLPRYRTELSVGLGSGIVAGEGARHRQLEKLTCVEIEPSVVQGAACFATANHGVLESPRVRIIVGDGVNHLMATRETYDIISSDEKTQPEYSVNGTFFSKEYYTLMKERLAPGGVAIQWIALDYPPRIFRCVLKTFSSVFPHVLLWQANGNCFLVGSNEELSPDLALIAGRLQNPDEPFDGIRKFGITRAETLVSYLVAREDELKKHLSGAEENTLEKPIIEFYDFADFATTGEQRELENLGLILAMRGRGAVGALLQGLPAPALASHAAEGEYLLGQQAILEGKDASAFAPHFERALSLSPDNQAIRYQIFGHFLATAKYHLARREMAAAENYLAKAVEVWPHDAESQLLYGRQLLEKGSIPEAARQLEASVKLDPGNTSTRHLLVNVLFQLRDIERAAAHLRVIVDSDSADIDALYRLGFLLGEKGHFREALKLLHQARQLAPDNPRVIHCLALVAFRSGDKEQARKIVEEGGSYYKAAKEMEEFREMIHHSGK